MCVPPDAVIVEGTSLHTKENAEQVLAILKQHGMSRIILMTSPFHQLRTYLTFVKYLKNNGNSTAFPCLRRNTDNFAVLIRCKM